MDPLSLLKMLRSRAVDSGHTQPVVLISLLCQIRCVNRSKKSASGSKYRNYCGLQSTRFRVCAFL